MATIQAPQGEVAMSLKIFVPKTEVTKRPLLTRRITFRLYQDLETDLLNDATQFGVSVNERILNILELHFCYRATHALSYPHDIRPLMVKRQDERRRTKQRNV